jgi:hypothetical protein
MQCKRGHHTTPGQQSKGGDASRRRVVAGIGAGLAAVAGGGRALAADAGQGLQALLNPVTAYPRPRGSRTARIGDLVSAQMPA